MQQMFLKLSSSSDLPFSNSATGNFPDQAIASLARSMLGFRHNKLSTAVIGATRSFAVSKRSSQALLVSESTVSSSLGSSVLCLFQKLHLHRPCSWSTRVLHSSESHLLISQPGQQVALPIFSRMCRVRSVLRDRTTVHSS